MARERGASRRRTASKQRGCHRIAVTAPSVFDLVESGQHVLAIAIRQGRKPEEVQREYVAEVERRALLDETQRKHDRELELARLDRALRALAPLLDRALVDPAAVREWRALCESRRKLLGLDAPTKVAATDPTGEHEALSTSVEDRDRRIAELVAIAMRKKS